MKRYKVKLTGLTPLLMHSDNLPFAQKVEKWRNDPNNKGVLVKGDDRSPAWKWLGALYTNGKYVCMPADNIMTALRIGATKIKNPANKKETFKKQSQCIQCDDFMWPFYVGPQEKLIYNEELEPLLDNDSFVEHHEAAQKLGFDLFVKRVTIGSGSKVISVRPIFREWSTESTITVPDEDATGLTHDVLNSIFLQAGLFAGLGNFRPSSPKSPGSHGKFEATVEQIG